MKFTNLPPFTAATTPPDASHPGMILSPSRTSLYHPALGRSRNPDGFVSGHAIISQANFGVAGNGEPLQAILIISRYTPSGSRRILAGEIRFHPPASIFHHPDIPVAIRGDGGGSHRPGEGIGAPVAVFRERLAFPISRAGVRLNRQKFQKGFTPVAIFILRHPPFAGARAGPRELFPAR